MLLKVDLKDCQLCQYDNKEIGLSFLFFFFFFVLFRAASMAYGGSQARYQIGATAASLHHSHSNSGSELRPRPTPQLSATLDP